MGLIRGAVDVIGKRVKSIINYTLKKPSNIGKNTTTQLMATYTVFLMALNNDVAILPVKIINTMAGVG